MQDEALVNYMLSDLKASILILDTPIFLCKFDSE